MLQSLLSMVESQLVDNEYLESFQLMSNFPKRNISQEDRNLLIKELFQGHPSQFVFVEERN